MLEEFQEDRKQRQETQENSIQFPRGEGQVFPN